MVGNVALRKERGVPKVSKRGGRSKVGEEERGKGGVTEV